MKPNRVHLNSCMRCSYPCRQNPFGRPRPYLAAPPFICTASTCRHAFGVVTVLLGGPSLSALPVQFFCPACGIATTSEANLEDHLTGRKHARRVQHLAKASTMPPASTTALPFGRLPHLCCLQSVLHTQELSLARILIGWHMISRYGHIFKDAPEPGGITQQGY